MLNSGVSTQIGNVGRSEHTERRDVMSTLSRPVLGIDVSHEHGRIAWADVAASGFSFAYARATEGAGSVDPGFLRNAGQAMDARIPFGACHFFRPDDDPARQAEFFLSAARFYLDPEPNWGTPGYLPPVLDIEMFPSQPGVLTAKVQTWLDVVESATGRRPVIYSGAGFWKIYLARTFQGQYPLWLAEYSGAQKPPSGVSSWTLWQQAQTQDVPGIDGLVDVNRLAPGLSVHELTMV